MIMNTNLGVKSKIWLIGLSLFGVSMGWAQDAKLMELMERFEEIETRMSYDIISPSALEESRLFLEGDTEIYRRFEECCETNRRYQGLIFLDIDRRNRCLKLQAQRLKGMQNMLKHLLSDLLAYAKHNEAMDVLGLLGRLKAYEESFAKFNEPYGINSDIYMVELAMVHYDLKEWIKMELNRLIEL